MKRLSTIFAFRLSCHLEADLKFWAIIPAFNVNLHSRSLEVEFLCFGLYVDIIK